MSIVEKQWSVHRQSLHRLHEQRMLCILHRFIKHPNGGGPGETPTEAQERGLHEENRCCSREETQKQTQLGDD